MKKTKLVIIGVLLATFTFQIPTFALTEKEEFELYKEFKRNKAKNKQKQSEKNNNQTTPVNININNNNNNNDSSNKNNKSSNSFLVYEQQKKSTVVGGLWSFFIPSAGHLYAQNWIRGSIFLALRVGSLLLMPESSYTTTQKKGTRYNYYYGDTDYYYYTEEYDESKAQMITICTYVYWLTTIFEIYDATKQVEKYNEKLIKNLNLGVSIRQNKPVYALTYKF